MALRLRLYIAGNGPNSQCAIGNLRAICDEHFKGDCKIEIVDLLEHPARALADRVVVTPTLIRLRPTPQARAIGNLNDRPQVLMMLRHG